MFNDQTKANIVAALRMLQEAVNGNDSGTELSNQWIEDFEGASYLSSDEMDALIQQVASSRYDFEIGDREISFDGSSLITNVEIPEQGFLTINITQEGVIMDAFTEDGTEACGTSGRMFGDIHHELMMDELRERKAAEIEGMLRNIADEDQLQEILGDMVHDYKSGEASDINNNSMRDQISYILTSCHFDLDAAVKVFFTELKDAGIDVTSNTDTIEGSV